MPDFIEKLGLSTFGTLIQSFCGCGRVLAMMGPRQEAQGALFYEFSLEDHVPADHLPRSIDRFVGLSGVSAHLAPFYSSTGRPSVDPELMIHMLLIGYCMGIRSNRHPVELIDSPRCQRPQVSARCAAE
jgi:hypothetical protein